MQDKIKWFTNEKGHGVIEYRGENIFILYSTNSGECVELELIKTDRGYEIKDAASTKKN